ncbi:unnamed protein product [Acanthosepion pharaonis]|uniref:Uncharacterized protein n=1 Tax=Acanthosepion pharaonis TaxID=158019 RepID=A0A812AUN0_ACAPH|nr:unnamed protein product [Sepia pharaonis]
MAFETYNSSSFFSLSLTLSLPLSLCHNDFRSHPVALTPFINSTFSLSLKILFHNSFLSPVALTALIHPSLSSFTLFLSNLLPSAFILSQLSLSFIILSVTMSFQSPPVENSPLFFIPLFLSLSLSHTHTHTRSLFLSNSTSNKCNNYAYILFQFSSTYHFILLLFIPPLLIPLSLPIIFIYQSL